MSKSTNTKDLRSSISIVVANYGVVGDQNRHLTNYIMGSLAKDRQQLIQRIKEEVIGEDLPLDQPGDDDMDNITLQGHLIFRKGVNWSKDNQRQILETMEEL